MCVCVCVCVTYRKPTYYMYMYHIAPVVSADTCCSAAESAAPTS